jgi:serine/threonine protein kinase
LEGASILEEHELSPLPFTILLADDNAVNRELWSAFLIKEGYQVLCSSGGEEALDLLAENPVDLILLDVVMPDMNGFEVLKELRLEFSPSAMPVIMVTAKDDSEDVVRGFDLGANDYVTKPLDVHVLLVRIQAQLRSKIPSASSSLPSQGPVIEEYKPGTVLDGKYRLDSLIDRGSFGAVYRAMHLSLKRKVAVKLLAATLDTDPASRTRFQQEGISTCQIQHPNAVAVLDFSLTTEGTPFLVMELLEGFTLDDEIKEDGLLDPLRCAVLLVPICEVLQEAHGLGIIHRDIKPQNIFLHHGRHGEVVKVLDFGIAKMVGEMALNRRITLEGSIVGTPAYMAPERLSDEPYDGRSDVYSLGVMLYEALGGRRPYSPRSGGMLELIQVGDRKPPPSLRELRPEIPEAIDRLVLETLERSPTARPTARELAARFTAALGLESASFSPTGSGRINLPSGLRDQLLGKSNRHTRTQNESGSGPLPSHRENQGNNSSEEWIATQPDLSHSRQHLPEPPEE